MFGLIGHLTSLDHAKAVAKDFGYGELAEEGFELWCSAPPQIVDDITVTSITGQKIHGKYVESFFLPEMLALRRIKTATRKILNAMSHAQKNGIDITALGGFSSIIFENFKLENSPQVRNVTLDFEKFTTGNTHTAYIICKQVEESAEKLGIDLKKSTVAVVGATGDIGSAVCRWMDGRVDVQDLLLVARNRERLEDLQGELGRGKIMDLTEALPEADVIVWVASMAQSVKIDVEQLKKPCLIVDGGYPKNMGATLKHPDVHVLSGGIVEHSLDIEWSIMNTADFELPNRQLFACFAESMILEFEKLYTNFSWGRNQITLEKMDQIGGASVKHGFKPLQLSSI